MIPRRLRILLVAALAASFAVGCLSRSQPEKQRFMLDAERPAPPEVSSSSPPHSSVGAEKGAGVLRVGRMRAAPQFERQGFVYRKGETTYERDFYNEFFEPPSVLVRQVTGGWMDASPLFSTVIGATDPSRADWLLEGRINDLYGDIREGGAPKSVLAISFTLFDDRSAGLETAFKKTYEVSVPADRTSAAAILAAWNEALRQILTELEGDLGEKLDTASRG